MTVKKEILFRKNFYIEKYDDGNIALRETFGYDDSSFIMFNKEEIKRLIKILNALIKNGKE